MPLINNDSVFIELVINSPVPKVWQAWTDPALILLWFGSDPKGEGIKAELHVQAGGRFEVSFKDSDGSTHTCFGDYQEVQLLSKLSFTWEWRSEPGVESFVTVLFFPEETGTLMLFEHTRLGTGSQHNYLYGWKNTFAKLEQLLIVS